MEKLTELEYTIGIVTALDSVLRSLGVDPEGELYAKSKDLFAKQMGHTLADIQLNKITKQIAEAQPME